SKRFVVAWWWSLGIKGRGYMTRRVVLPLSVAVLLLSSTRTETNTSLAQTGSVTLPGNIQTVFVIVMENQNWSSVLGSTSAPDINSTLLPIAAHAERYNNPPGMHPSLPNYLWLAIGGTQVCWMTALRAHTPRPGP